MSNDQASFEAFVAARAAARAANVLTGDPHLAEDLVQSALLKAAEHWGRLARGLRAAHDAPPPGLAVAPP